MEFFKVTAVLVQVFPISNNTLGGVSGQEFIWRAALSLMDQSLGMGYFVGLYNMVFEPSPSYGRLHQWDLVHTRIGQSVESIEVSYRHEWSALASQQRRRGRVFEVDQVAAVQSPPSTSSSQAVAGPSAVYILRLLFKRLIMILPSYRMS